MNSFEQEIAEALAATGSFEKEAALKLISVPPDTTHGNFTIPCFSLAKVMRKAPKMIAEDLAAQVKLPAGLSKVEAVNGYLNFFIDRGFLAKLTLEGSETRFPASTRPPATRWNASTTWATGVPLSASSS